ncbi:MAG TPA: HEAT repeat domain-containing protein [Methylomirabilota bacterium]
MRADKVPLYGILSAIGAQTDLELGIPEAGEGAGPLVTIDFEDLPIEEGIQRLLRRHLTQSNYMIVFDADGRLAGVHILGAASSWPAAPPQAAAPTASRPAGPARRLTTGEVSAEASDDPLEQALEKARTATDLEARVKALLALGDFQDPRTLALLHPALRSDSPDVRQAALAAMREGTVDEPRVLADVRSVVTSDPDPTVREAALEVLVRYDETVEARELLRVLAADKDSPFRAFAQKNVERMEEEARYRAGSDTQVQNAGAPRARGKVH